MDEHLMSYAEAYFSASQTFSGQRIDLLTYYFVAVSAAFGFWVSLENADRQARLRAPLVTLLALAAAFIAVLVAIVSKDVAVYWTVGEKTLRQIVDVADGETTSRNFFSKKYDEAVTQYWQVHAWNRFLIWSLPPLIYGFGLVVAAYRVVSNRAASSAK